MPTPGKDFGDFYADFKSFQGQMMEFKTTTERRFNELNVKVDSLQEKVQGTCPYHDDVVALVKSGADKTTAQDKTITDLEKKDIVHEMKLNARQEAQLNLTTIFATLIAVWEAVKYILKIP